jgi:hypothetical protein
VGGTGVGAGVGGTGVGGTGVGAGVGGTGVGGTSLKHHTRPVKSAGTKILDG